MTPTQKKQLLPTWLIKTEPETYSYDDLVREGSTAWTGVRNYTARNHLRSMRQGERCFVYHSVGPKEIVGIVEVSREHYPDPTAEPEEEKKSWVVVDVKPLHKLDRPIGLAEVKAHPLLSGMELVRQSRLSVCPVTAAEAETLLSLAARAP